MSFRAALDRQHALCPAGCACAGAARAAPPLVQHVDTRSYGSSCSDAPRGLRAYLSTVYPVVARERLAKMSDADVSKFFDSLHFYYDFGCSRNLASVEACNEPGVMLRWLYSGLLPCREENTARRPSVAHCLRAHAQFAPEWARTAVTSGFVEVEHRAIGFPLRANGVQLSGLLIDGKPSNASVFLDAGVASAWYTVRRGSGIFYRLGRVKMAPGKTALVADLLQELSERPTLAASWPGIAARSNLFAATSPSAGASADADRLRAVANGSASCVDARVQSCRCRYVLHDSWDDAMTWMARALSYETLFITATLLCNQPMDVLGATLVGGSSSSHTHDGRGTNVQDAGDATSSSSSRGFATAYPELVDVRPLGAAMVREQAHGVHAYLQEPVRAGGVPPSANGTGIGGVVELHTRRKRPEAADAWVRQMREKRLLSLRDPFDVGSEARARSCSFSVRQWTLQCDHHVSSRWQDSSWARCGIVGCGYAISGGTSRNSSRISRQAARQDGGSSAPHH